jgi:serine protease Do
MNTKWMAASMIALLVSGTAMAQQHDEVVVEGRKLKKDESITVRKKGDSKEKITIVVDGEKVSVNGKPIEGFKDENVEIIRNRNVQGYKVATFPRVKPVAGVRAPMDIAYNYNFDGGIGTSFSSGGNKAQLGVHTEKDEKGARITSITKGSAAEKAGLKKYDIIKKINDTKVENDNDLYEAIGKFKPEDKVTVTYIRDGVEATATATLQKNKTISWASGDTFFAYGKPRIGLQVQDVEEGDGVKVLDVDDDTPAAKAGLKENDVITEVNGKDLKNVDEFRTASKDLKDGDVLKVKYKRDGKSTTTEIKIPKKLKTANL